MARHLINGKPVPAVPAPFRAAGSAQPAASNPAGWARHSGIQPASGGAADLRQLPTSNKRSGHTVLRSPGLSASRPRAVPCHTSPAADLKAEIIDGLGTIAAMLVLACVAVALLVIA